jgi:aspartate kinase
MSRAMLDGFAGITVFPGFYANTKDGAIITLPRGGSDTSGAVVARAVAATVYENWTDEDGLRRANPKIVTSPAFIPEMTYTEALELAYADFKLQDACFEPIKGTGIVLNVRNTNNPDHPGTRIMDTRAVDPKERILGVARQKGLVAINMCKQFVEQEVGFGRRLFSILERRNISYEHQPNGVHTASIVLNTKFLKGENSLENVMADINRECRPDSINSIPLALVSAAGLGMQHHLDVNSRIFAALLRAGIKTLMIDEGAADLSIFIGVEDGRADDAVRAIYAEFYG